MNTFKRKIGLIAFALLAGAIAATLGGCGHDQALAKSQADSIAAQANARTAEAQRDAEEAKAVQRLADKLDAGGATAYLVTKALRGAGASAPAPVLVSQPQSLLGLAWQSVLQVADLALRGYGIKAGRDVGIAQVNANRDTSIASYGAFTAMGGAIERAGTAGYPFVQSPQPNITNTLSGTGVLGSGTYNAPVTTTTTTTACNGGTGAAGGAGAGTTTGGAGGVGGSAPGGSC